jgi:hypothetical protein
MMPLKGMAAVYHTGKGGAPPAAWIISEKRMMCLKINLYYTPNEVFRQVWRDGALGALSDIRFAFFAGLWYNILV